MSLTIPLTKSQVGELLSWINRLEISLENFQTHSKDLFSTNSDSSKRSLLDSLISSSEAWGDRPHEIIRELYEIASPSAGE